MSVRFPNGDTEEEKMFGGEEDDDIDGGSSRGWGLLERACLYFESGSFQRALDAFVRYSELHAQYLQLVETLLSEFLENEGHTAEELFSDMKDAKENNYTALFEEHEYHGFVQGVLAAMEYQSFYRIMVAAAKERGSGQDSSTGSPRQEGRARSCSGDGREPDGPISGGVASREGGWGGGPGGRMPPQRRK